MKQLMNVPRIEVSKLLSTLKYPQAEKGSTSLSSCSTPFIVVLSSKSAISKISLKRENHLTLKMVV